MPSLRLASPICSRRAQPPATSTSKTRRSSLTAIMPSLAPRKAVLCTGSLWIPTCHEAAHHTLHRPDADPSWPLLLGRSPGSRPDILTCHSTRLLGHIIHEEGQAWRRSHPGTHWSRSSRHPRSLCPSASDRERASLYVAGGLSDFQLTLAF